MRRTLLIIAALGLLGIGAGGAQAAPGPWDAPPVFRVQPIQGYYAPQYAPHYAPHYSERDDGWDRRRAWRERRHAEEQARIEETARREAWRIEQEREARRAWRHQQREQWYGGGYDRRW